MKRRRWLRLGFLLGYVVGTRAGRERYEDMRRAVLRLRATGPFRSAESKVRERVRGLRNGAVTSTDGAFATAPYDPALADLRGPGLQP